MDVPTNKIIPNHSPTRNKWKPANKNSFEKWLLTQSYMCENPTANMVTCKVRHLKELKMCYMFTVTTKIHCAVTFGVNQSNLQCIKE